MLALSDHELAGLLRDDLPFGDLTTETLGFGHCAGALRFSARHAMTAACTEEAVRMFQLAGAAAELVSPSGTTAAPGTLLLHASGSAASLHAGWKAAQVLVEWASGVATAAAAIVAAAGDVPVACTRKNAPGTKALSAKAVRAGGATMHRLGLSETLLVFAEHRMFMNETPAQIVARLKRRQPEKKVVVEVAAPDEATAWAQAGADVLQLEKFSPEQVAQLRGAIGASTVLLAIAGGVRADNAAAYVAAGADMLVTSAPYAAPPRDVQVDFRSAS